MENHKEDILKKFLQDTFSDYEPEPNEQSWENIFSAIQPIQPTFWGKSKPWVASILVILTGVWLWYGSPDVEANNLEIAFNSNEPLGVIAMNKAKQSDDSQTGKTRQSENKQTFITKQLEDINTAQIIENQNITSLKNIYDMKRESVVTKYSKEIVVKNDIPKEEVENHPIVEKWANVEVISKDNVTTSISERMGKIFTGTEGSGRGKILATHIAEATVEESGQVGTFATGMNSIIERVRYIDPMESLRNKDFILTKIAVNLPVITPIMAPNREVKPIRQHTYLNMSITPIQTYRILTINNHAVQNVQTSDLFNSERNGWQFDFGVIKPIGKLWNFRSNLSYLRMRQWSEYQISTNELILRNTNYGNSAQGALNALEVVGQTVTESKNLHMIGLKMDVQKFFKITANNRYFISTGTQLMYENTQKQSNIFLNVSAGFQHIVSQTTFLTIEPIASYSLNNFNDSKSLLQANGYNLGLKMGVSFKVK